MHIASSLPHKVTCVLILVFASMVSTHSPAQSGQAKDTTPPQEKKAEEKTPGTTEQRGGIQILSDTMGFDFGPYMKRLKYTVQSHWDGVIPESARPPANKSGTVTIELAVMKDGRVQGMKLVKSSGDTELDRAAWNGITDAVPLPALPLGFKGDHLQLRCTFLYNPAAKPAQETKQDPKK